ncbi:hypothetical protein WPS_03970 [Vulcanimicrobium alpinum]|uniref:DUF3887 domain-containing protein n=1 Tax=Vulcanimicrobium alpinum TaxID=3016050 RepID=A0AAN1XVD3_UNVUL|nr:hypothetical protein [Vulcanimicrobium alpinum]BDE05121.1 hypothetical protein WPS_03970 [Vulcanimicrobium alpinum]
MSAPAPGLRNVTPPPRARQNSILILALVVVVVALVLRACAGGENTYEKIAHQFTQAVQNNDLAAVQKLENSQTAADTTHGRLGRGADAFGPLGKIKRVKETPTNDTTPRVHEFDVTFEKGTVHEKLQFDPQNKVFRFRYDAPVPKT